MGPSCTIMGGKQSKKKIIIINICEATVVRLFAASDPGGKFRPVTASSQVYLLLTGPSATASSRPLLLMLYDGLPVWVWRAVALEEGERERVELLNGSAARRVASSCQCQASGFSLRDLPSCISLLSCWLQTMSYRLPSIDQLSQEEIDAVRVVFDRYDIGMRVLVCVYEGEEGRSCLVRLPPVFCRCFCRQYQILAWNGIELTVGS